MTTLADALRALEEDPLAPHRDALAGVEAPPARRFYAAAHVAVDAAGAIDWDATFRLRRWLDSHGLGVAEAMDTAQRFELGWDVARRLIEDTGALALENGFVAGVAADHLAGKPDRDELVAGVAYQARVVRGAGGVPVLLPLLALPAGGATEEDYVAHYTAVIDACDGPLLVHWLGEAFHPGLAGYFPGASFARVMAHDTDKVRGCKLSLLDAALERRVRAELLPRRQVVLTGDDLHFAELVVEDGAPPERTLELDGRPLPVGPFSHALRGVLDGVAVPAGLALRALAAGDAARARALLEPCEAYGRHVFAPPVAHYKAGLAFTAYLAGLQENPRLPGGLEQRRDTQHYLRAAELAARAGAFEDRTEAAERLEAWAATR